MGKKKERKGDDRDSPHFMVGGHVSTLLITKLTNMTVSFPSPLLNRLLARLRPGISCVGEVGLVRPGIGACIEKTRMARVTIS